MAAEVQGVLTIGTVPGVALSGAGAARTFTHLAASVDDRGGFFDLLDDFDHVGWI